QHPNELSELQSGPIGQSPDARRPCPRHRQDPHPAPIDPPHPAESCVPCRGRPPLPPAPPTVLASPYAALPPAAPRKTQAATGPHRHDAAASHAPARATGDESTPPPHRHHRAV